MPEQPLRQYYHDRESDQTRTAEHVAEESDQTRTTGGA